MFALTVKNFQPSEAHRDLVELFYNGKIQVLICLNWDILIEKAYRERYNGDVPKVIKSEPIKVNGPFMWKPHGCVSNNKIPWILSYEKKDLFSINDRVRTQMVKSCNKTPYVFVTIGYSGKEDAINGLLNDPSEKYCIGNKRVQSIKGRDLIFIKLTASEALDVIKSKIIH